MKDQMLDAMLQQAQLTCDHSEVRSLFLRREEAALHGCPRIRQGHMVFRKFPKGCLQIICLPINLGGYMGLRHTESCVVKSCEGQKLP